MASRARSSVVSLGFAGTEGDVSAATATPAPESVRMKASRYFFTGILPLVVVTGCLYGPKCFWMQDRENATPNPTPRAPANSDGRDCIPRAPVEERRARSAE